jgi:hypothetical protein
MKQREEVSEAASLLPAERRWSRIGATKDDPHALRGGNDEAVYCMQSNFVVYLHLLLNSPFISVTGIAETY